MRTTLLIMVMIVLSLFMGCGLSSEKNEQYSAREIVPIIEKKLNEKYARVFLVQDIAEGNKGQNFWIPYYYAKVVTDGDDRTFDATIDSDGSGITDNYESHLYGDEVEEELEMILERYSRIIFSESKVVYRESNVVSKNAEEYRKKGVAEYQACGKVSAESLDEAVRSVEELVNALQMEGFNISLAITYKNQTAILVYDYNDVMKDDTVREQFSRS